MRSVASVSAPQRRPAEAAAGCIAFLIQVHAAPEMLHRLIGALRAPWVHFFVHIDAIADPAPFTRGLADLSDVTFLRDRLCVHWGGWSQVEAPLRLMRAAIAKDVQFERFILLSGSCYPLRSNAALRRFLFADQIEHITSYRMPSYARDKPMTRLSRWHIEGGLQADGSHARFTRILNDVARLLPDRDVIRGLNGRLPYAGSAWWTLTRPAVEEVLATVAHESRLVEFYRYTRNSDESFFHTVLSNSSFANKIAPTLMFTDWSEGKGIARPCLLGERHLDCLLNPDFVQPTGSGPGPVFFARKFTPASAHLLDKIDKSRF